MSKETCSHASRDALEEALVAYFDTVVPGAPTPTAGTTEGAARVDVGRAAIHATVVAVVRAEHAVGTAPEQVVVLLKKITMDAYHRASGSTGARGLREDVVRWAIDAYYGQ